MKPRIRLKHSVWCCLSVDNRIPICSRLVIGYGYTPAEAYEDWKKQQEAM